MPETTRLAPSPTGALHLGNARTFALTWWWARRHAARIVLRIEDLDSPRKKRWAIDQAIEDLTWLGLDWDAGPVLQTTRHAEHEAALAKLQGMGLVYACSCSRRDLQEAHDAPQGHAETRYPGTCRGRYDAPQEAWEAVVRPIALRLRVPTTPISFRDELAGDCTVNLDEVGGDFILARWDPAGGHRFAYQLGVVVDDAVDAVDAVLRGDDLLASTPRQRFLQDCLGLNHPRTWHLPLVVGEDGRRLAKRHGDTRLSAYREAGLDPARIRAWIGASAELDAAWWEDPQSGAAELGDQPRGAITVPGHALSAGPPISARE